MSVISICGFCKKQATWMIAGTEPACNEHLVTALDDYDIAQLERIDKIVK